MLDAYSQLVRIYDNYMNEFPPTTVPSKGGVIMPPVYYNKVRHSDNQPVYIANIDRIGQGRIEKAEIVRDDEYHSTLCPSTLSQRIIGSSSRNKEFQFFTKMGILATPITKKRWLSLYQEWCECYPIAQEQVLPIVEYVEHTDFNKSLVEIRQASNNPNADPYVIFYIDGKNIFVNNEPLYNEYVEFYEDHLEDANEYFTERRVDPLSQHKELIVLGKDKDFLSFGVNYANLSKIITKTNPSTTLENNDIFPTVKKNFSSFTLSVENNFKIVLAFDYLCELKRQFSDSRRLVFLSPDNNPFASRFSTFLGFNRMAGEIENFLLMRIEKTKDIEQLMENHATITVLEWKQNDLAKGSFVKCDEISVEDYVNNINHFVSFIKDYIGQFIWRLEHAKAKQNFKPMFTMSNLLCNFYIRGTSPMKKHIESIYGCIIRGRPIQPHIMNDMIRYIVHMIQAQSMNQITRHYKGYKTPSNYILDSLAVIAGMIEYNKSFEKKEENMETDRSYVYGQILATYQKIEEVVMWNQSGGKSHATIVEKNLSNFIGNPNRYFLLIQQRMTPYLNKSYGYKNVLEILFSQLPYKSTEGIVPSDEVITSNFLLGYYHQLKALNTKKNDNKSNENDKENNNE